jgi:two-component system, response regulator, stage 0 sporulation protein F
MKKILITDHDYAVRLLFQMELEDEGYTVNTTDDYENLIDRVKRFRPNLVLFDVGSGENNELGIYHKLRNRFCEMPIILCSACNSIFRDLKFTAPDGSLVKSINLSELKSIVRMAFENASEANGGFVSNNADAHFIEAYAQHGIPEDYGTA